MNNVLQALIHFFKNVGTNQAIQLDQKTLMAELDQFGVSLAELESTLAKMVVWAASQSQPSSSSSLHSNSSLTHVPQEPPLAGYAVQPHTGSRIFTSSECDKISKKSRGFLVKIEQAGILSPQVREMIIDQLMQVEIEDQIRLAHTKWIAFQILFHDAPPEHIAYLEWLLFAKLIDIH